MSIIPSVLSQACCCATPEPSDVEGRIMSKFGLITECNVGIKPVANDVLACVMQASNWSQQFDCDPFGTSGTTGYDREQIIVPYTLSVDEAISGTGHRPAHHIWWTKNRCLEFDQFYPGANACCCSGGELNYPDFFASVPAPSGTTLQQCGIDDQGGPCADGTFVEDANACYLVGDPVGSPQPLVGKYEQLWEQTHGTGTLFWWSFNPYYPVATTTEQYEAHGTAGQVCNTTRQNRNNQGLSTYQVRTAKYRQPDIWEILNFNDGRGIAFMRNNPSAVAARGRVNYYERGDVYSAESNAVWTPPYYIVSPDQWDARGAHGLFRYFCAFVSEEFSYVKGETPDTPFLRQNNRAYDILLGRALPTYFHQIADAVPIFSFATDFVQCPGAGGTGFDSLTKALMEEDVPYAKQQIADPSNLDGTNEYWQAQCLAVDDAMRTSEMVDMLACKDWRGEILEDIVTCSTFAANHDLAWSAMLSLASTYQTADDLKPVGPVRLRGDWFDLRDISAATGLVDLSKRPPSLARCQDDATSVGDEYLDSLTGQRTLQVDSAIYNVVTAPSGFYQTASAATGIVINKQYRILFVGTTDYTTCGAASNAVGTVFVATGTATGSGLVQLFDEDAYFAFQRLTQSVYFRTKPAGWDFNARFQDGEPVTLIASFSWLGNRRDVKTADVAAGTALESVGGQDNVIDQPQWCVNGTPQDSTITTPTGPCLTVNCDVDFGATVAYEWNSSIFVARHTRVHFYNGQSVPVCRGYDTPLQTSGGCCRVTEHTSSESDPSCPYDDSNICFVRFVNRPYQWYDGAAPFRMEPTSSNVVDRNPICCEYPHVLQRVCDVNSSETQMRSGGTWGNFEPDPATSPPCSNDDCTGSTLPGQQPCVTTSSEPCPLAGPGPAAGYGIGSGNCGDVKYAAQAPDLAVAFKTGYGYYFNPFSGVNEWVLKPQCLEQFKDNGQVGAPDVRPDGGPRRYPVGHVSGTRGTGFIMQSYPSDVNALQSSECCSIDDRSDQYMGLNVQKRHWLSFPAYEIVTY